MSKTRLAGLFWLLVVVSVPAAGCGNSDEGLARVKGSVTLDGKPLTGASVEFEPESGSPSYGKTDGNGWYKLMYTQEKAGAVIGKHTVRIRTREITTDENGREVFVPERLPAKYHLRSELTAEVEPGRNKFHFELHLAGPTASGGG